MLLDVFIENMNVVEVDYKECLVPQPPSLLLINHARLLVTMGNVSGKRLLSLVNDELS